MVLVVDDEAKCRKVRESSGLPIIMMTAKSDEESIVGGLQVDRANRRVVKNGSAVRLTPSKYKILLLLMCSPQKTFSRNGIIFSVKTDEYDGFDRTVDSHIKNLRQKIEDDIKSPRYVVTVHGFGYRYGGSVCIMYDRH